MAAGLDQKTKQLYEFGPFRVDPERELLLRDNEAIPLAPKAFQVLLVLIRNNKEIVTKDELLKAVWPDTFVEETNLSRNIFLLRKALGESPQDHQYIVTVPGHGYRFAEDVQLVSEEELSIVAATHAKVEVQVKETNPWGWITVAVILLVAVAAGAYKMLVHRRQPVLTAKDTVVLADFVNQTGDPVFDGTLWQGLAIQLEQSPFLSLISDQRVRQTLPLMGQLPDARITPQIAQDLCQRTQSAAYLAGSIASLGSQYVIGLKAVNCTTGDLLADEQETASGKEKVLGALDNAASRLREKLGESLSTLAKFDTPLEQATTPSLEAFQAYTMGRRNQSGRDEFAASVPFYERAIRLDPNFAIAYSTLGSVYWNLGETRLGEQNAKKAYELRSSVSEPERFYIESTYYHYVTGDLEKARQIYESWTQTYPRNSSPRIRLWQLYFQEGQYAATLPQTQEAIRLDPWKGMSFNHLVASLIYLNRLPEANRAAQQAIADHRLDSTDLNVAHYRLAFLANDPPGMSRAAESVVGKPDLEAKMFNLEAQTATYSGHLREARNLSRQAVESAMRAGESEEATNIEAQAALREALFGTEVSVHSKPSLGIPTGRAGQYAAALSLAIAGDSARAQLLADDLARRYPDDTLVKFTILPTIRAQIELNRSNPSKAIELLQPATPYELSDAYLWGFLGPVYVRGEAYLMAHRGNDAAVEFQKILDHRGIVVNSPIGVLAHLQLGRAYVLMGENAKAKSEYQEFLTLLKDADPDIPILQQSKAEYAELK